jgi:hypothetical protein
VSFLAPLYLALAGAIAVPLLIHLLRRRIGARVEFPAARYLARAEREHSRTLRIRNLLLMLLRVLILLALAVAAARPVARWAGGGHAPTALAIVVDNSLSSGAVVNGRPLLDQFKTMARDVLATAAAGDRLWLITIDGRVRGGSAATLRDEVNRLEPLAGAGDASEAVARAAGVVRASGLAARTVAIVTDGQRTEWQHVPSLGDLSLVTYAPSGAPPVNHAVTLAEARPVRWTPRGEVAARFLSRDSTSYRMTINGRTFARGTAGPNEEVAVHASPPERGWLSGTVELEPDELAGDNVRHFAVWIGPPPGVAVASDAGTFVQNAVEVLRAGQRIVDGHDVAVVPADALTSLPALIVAPSDPVKLGAANRALERAGIPWRFGVRRTGAADVHGSGLDGTSVSLRYDLVPQAGAAADTLASIGRDPWIVAGSRYVLVGSPITPDATTLPVRASFVPWMGGVLTERLVGEPGQVIAAQPGAHLTRPRWADGLSAADGQPLPLTDAFDAPARGGTYFFTLAGRRVGALVVDAPSGESSLERFTGEALAAQLGASKPAAARSAADWATLAFRAAARRSLITPILVFALVMLIIEAIAIGTRSRRLAA